MLLLLLPVLSCWKCTSDIGIRIIVSVVAIAIASVFAAAALAPDLGINFFSGTLHNCNISLQHSSAYCILFIVISSNVVYVVY